MMRSVRLGFGRGCIFGLAMGLSILCSSGIVRAGKMYLGLDNAVVVVRSGDIPSAERAAARVLVEEVEKRTRIRWEIRTEWPPHGTVIAITTRVENTGWDRDLPKDATGISLRPEGYQVYVEEQPSKPRTIWVVGADPRGTLFGVGYLLRKMVLSNESAMIEPGMDICTAPVYPIRGHQLGYRNKANSYDAFSPEQYEQYIRELAIFGTNSIENIPFHDSDVSPHSKVPRREMNRRLSEICAEYDLDYWVWTPAEGDLSDAEFCKKELAMHEQLYQDCPRIDGVFFPGGDPGDNHPKTVLPFLEELSRILAQHHPETRIWLSLQGFDDEKTNYVRDYVQKNQPKWMGGIVGGPSSPPMAEIRAWLPKQYGLRDYPDVTHSVRAQYPVVWWDPALALIHGRESSNPRPMFYSAIHRWTAPGTDGFISYSDGVHDDVNKVLWSMLGWKPDRDIREILVDYCRFFFGADVAEPAADGIFALEKNWSGPLAQNGSVESTYTHWTSLEEKCLKRYEKGPGERPLWTWKDEKHFQWMKNWRWQLCMLRAEYDAHIRHRLIAERELEAKAYRILAGAQEHGIDKAMDDALAVLQSVDKEPILPDLRERIVKRCEGLFETIGLQTSVPRFQGANSQRGCILDFIDRPLNNRWWLEDQFTEIRKLPNDAEKLERLELIRTWDNPGPGSYYDDLGNIEKSPHLYRGESIETGPPNHEAPTPTYWAWDGGFSRMRVSWLDTMGEMLGLRYENLDSNEEYVLRLTGEGEAFPNVNGKRIEPTVYGKKDGEFKIFPIPKPLTQNGTIEVTFDFPDESKLNWRDQSRIAEVWLVRK
ncbi:MAG TPA: hypothetical protein PLZ55_03555 [bacterium]|nr:hypothetical protein [bacterium]